MTNCGIADASKKFDGFIIRTGYCGSNVAIFDGKDSFNGSEKIMKISPDLQQDKLCRFIARKRDPFQPMN